MSLRSDGTNRCDKCGVDVGSGGVDTGAVVSVYDADAGTVLVLHLCREPRDGFPRGCTGKVLGPGTLADYTSTRSE